MRSILRSTLNTRVLPDGSGRFIRSDAPVRLTDDEISALIRHGVTTIVDLRTGEEAAARPCRLRGIPGFAYHHLPVTGGGDVPATREQLHAVYLGMADGRMDEILGVILGAPSRVLYFCTAGKDRTGVVSALLMQRLGCSTEAIVRDYMVSKANLADMLAAYAAEHPDVQPDVITPCEENILHLLAGVNQSARAPF